ncbi:MAG: NHL repeat-containing protein [Candidatus Eremiobacteraeota bacterium]|nr:NHL repeat-containing protein [Candidatus Eremiobacteraeota bacterium]
MFAPLGLSAGCAGLDTVGSAAEPTPATSVTVYATGAIGDAAPIRTILGPRTGLRFPSAIAVDARGKQYVANRAGNSVTVYSSNARGDAAPLRTIVGSRTGLNLPTGLAVDAQGDVYVANRSGNMITVYAPTANGNAKPIRTVEGSMTDLNEPTSIAVDAEQTIYVTNLANHSVTLFARGASGNVAPVRVIRGKRARLTAAFAITVDRAGAIYVVNSDEKDISGVIVFAPRASGDVAPIRVIAGSATKLETPSGVAVDPRGPIFVSDHGGSSSAGAIRVYAKGANGNSAPLYSIAGSATRLRPYGLTIDRTREIYVVNQAN